MPNYFLLGDLFDFGLSIKPLFLKVSSSTWQNSRNSRQRNSNLFFVGNHDLWMEDYFQRIKYSCLS
jgi:UDP-2,3-diacylglucosamine pyrophosphatase LpxH